MEEWKEYKALDFCYNVTDGTHDSPKPKDEGRYLITSKHLKDGYIDFATANKISEEDYQKIIQRSKVEQFDILYSMIGTIGNIYRVVDDKVDFAVKNMGIFKMGGDQLKSKWLYYWLKTPLAKEYVNSRLAGSTQSYMTLKSLREFPVYAPDEDKINKIINILSSLDDKIEVNRRINEQLEELAQALFKSWFVDFEPFKDGEFVESELGMIPEGWRVCELSELLFIAKESVNPSKTPNDIFYHYSIPAYDNNKREEIQLGSTILSNKFKVANKMTLFSKLNPRIKRVWFLDDVENNAICSTEFVPYKAKDNDLVYFIDRLINSDSFYNKVMSIVNGATGSHQRFQPKDTLKFMIAYNEEVAKQYNKIVEPLLKKILVNLSEITHLTNLRDTLLPKLMSGEIDVNQVEI